MLGVSCQITDKIILKLGVDVLPYFKALDVVEGPSELERPAEVSLLDVGGIGVGRCIYAQDIIALIFEDCDEGALTAADIDDALC